MPILERTHKDDKLRNRQGPSSRTSHISREEKLGVGDTDGAEEQGGTHSEAQRETVPGESDWVTF